MDVRRTSANHARPRDIAQLCIIGSGWMLYEPRGYAAERQFTRDFAHRAPVSRCSAQLLVLRACAWAHTLHTPGHSHVQFSVNEQRSRAVLPPKALTALTAALVAAIVIAVLSYRSLTTRSATANAVQHTEQVTSQLDQLLVVLTD